MAVVEWSDKAKIAFKHLSKRDKATVYSLVTEYVSLRLNNRNARLMYAHAIAGQIANKLGLENPLNPITLHGFCTKASWGKDKLLSFHQIGNDTFLQLVNHYIPLIERFPVGLESVFDEKIWLRQRALITYAVILQKAYKKKSSELLQRKVKLIERMLFAGQYQDLRLLIEELEDSLGIKERLYSDAFMDVENVKSSLKGPYNAIAYTYFSIM